jgi:hypothetical protein
MTCVIASHYRKYAAFLSDEVKIKSGAAARNESDTAFPENERTHQPNGS